MINIFKLLQEDEEIVIRKNKIIIDALIITIYKTFNKHRLVMQTEFDFDNKYILFPNVFEDNINLRIEEMLTKLRIDMTKYKNSLRYNKENKDILICSSCNENVINVQKMLVNGLCQSCFQKCEGGR